MFNLLFSLLKILITPLLSIIPDFKIEPVIFNIPPGIEKYFDIPFLVNAITLVTSVLIFEQLWNFTKWLVEMVRGK